jgi:ribosomal protein S2
MKSIGINNNQLQYAVDFTMGQLVAAGVQIGHREKFVDQRMFEVLLGQRHGIYIIDLTKSIRAMKPSLEIMVALVSKRRRLLFANVDARIFSLIPNSVKNFCLRYFIVNRKLPGILTNFFHLRKLVPALKLSKYFPSFAIAFSNYDHHILWESNLLNLPSMGIFDSNTNSSGHSFYAVPGNDDSFGARFFYYNLVFKALKTGFQRHVLFWGMKKNTKFKKIFNFLSKYLLSKQNLFKKNFFLSDFSNFFTNYYTKLISSSKNFNQKLYLSTKFNSLILNYLKPLKKKLFSLVYDKNYYKSFFFVEKIQNTSIETINHPSLIDLILAFKKFNFIATFNVFNFFVAKSYKFRFKLLKFVSGNFYLKNYLLNKLRFLLLKNKISKLRKIQMVNPVFENLTKLTSSSDLSKSLVILADGNPLPSASKFFKFSVINVNNINPIITLGRPLTSNKFAQKNKSSMNFLVRGFLSKKFSHNDFVKFNLANKIIKKSNVATNLILSRKFSSSNNSGGSKIYDRIISSDKYDYQKLLFFFKHRYVNWFFCYLKSWQFLNFYKKISFLIALKTIFSFFNFQLPKYKQFKRFTQKILLGDINFLKFLKSPRIKRLYTKYEIFSTLDLYFIFLKYKILKKSFAPRKKLLFNSIDKKKVVNFKDHFLNLAFRFKKFIYFSKQMRKFELLHKNFLRPLSFKNLLMHISYLKFMLKNNLILIDLVFKRFNLKKLNYFKTYFSYWRQILVNKSQLKTFGSEKFTENSFKVITKTKKIIKFNKTTVLNAIIFNKTNKFKNFTAKKIIPSYYLEPAGIKRKLHNIYSAKTLNFINKSFIARYLLVRNKKNNKIKLEKSINYASNRLARAFKFYQNMVQFKPYLFRNITEKYLPKFIDYKNQQARVDFLKFMKLLGLFKLSKKKFQITDFRNALSMVSFNYENIKANSLNYLRHQYFPKKYPLLPYLSPITFLKKEKN